MTVSFIALVLVFVASFTVLPMLWWPWRDAALPVPLRVRSTRRAVGGAVSRPRTTGALRYEHSV